MERKYIAFISYRHAQLDSAVAKQVHTLVEQFVIPKNMRKDGKRLGLVFRDQEELPVSSDLSADISRALDQSQYLIVICSENTAHSPWVGREIDYFLSHHDRKNAFAVLASGEPQDVFPRALTQIVHEDGTITDVEPLAVDVRAEDIAGTKKKLKREITRLHAALIGCPYDALVMREQRRKRRRLAAVMAVILTVVTSFSALMLVKNRQINEKNQELNVINGQLNDKNDELNNKNEELARQKAQVQLRESELLTEKGMAALATGDTQAALENFLGALPSRQEQRPYYALAEQGLTATLDVFGRDRQTQKAFSIPLQQDSPIQDYLISPEADRVMTVDSYGMLTCFDSGDGSVLWSVQASDNRYLITTGVLLGTTPENRAIVSLSGWLAAVDWATGQILWQFQADNYTTPILSRDGTMIAYLQRDWGGENPWPHHYVFVSGQTGQILQTISLGASGDSGNVTDGIPAWYVDFEHSRDSQSNVFSEDGRFFATAVREKHDDGSYTRKYFLLDLQAGSCKVLCTIPLAEDEQTSILDSLYFAEEGAALLSIYRPDTSGIAAQIEKIDIKTGKRLWNIQTPKEGSLYFWSSDPVQSVLENDRLFLCRKDRMYALNTETREEMHRSELPGQAIALEALNPYVHNLVLNDGSYTLCWGNQNGIFLASSWLTPALELGSAERVELGNGGAYRVDMTEKTIDRIYAGRRQDGHGFAVVLPQKEADRLLLKYVVDFDPVLQEETAVSMESDEYLSAGSLQRLGDSLLVGPISQNSLSDTEDYFLMNADTYAQQPRFQLPSYIPEDSFHMLPDGAGYYLQDKEFHLNYYDLSTGETRAVYKNEELVVPIPNDMDVTFLYDRFAYSGAVQNDSNRLLMAAMEEGSLHWWYDTQEPVQVPIPEDLQTQNFTVLSCERFLRVGANGYILVGVFENEDALVDGFAAYHVPTGSWHRFAQDLELQYYEMATMGERASLMAVCDTQGNALVYNMAQEQQIGRIPLQLPRNAVDHLLLLNDRYLLAQTTDQWLMIYEIASGQRVYSTQVEGYSDGKLCVAEDEKNGRLYLWSDSSNTDDGICLDMASWTELTKINGLIHYDPKNNEVYCFATHWEDDTEGIRVCKVPTLAELVEAGEKLLAK